MRTDLILVFIIWMFVAHEAAYIQVGSRPSGDLKDATKGGFSATPHIVEIIYGSDAVELPFTFSNIDIVRIRQDKLLAASDSRMASVMPTGRR